MKEYTRDELRALTPARYLANGFLDQAGKPRRELRSEYATAASTQFTDAQLAPQELALTFEMLRQLIEMEKPTSGGAFRDVVADALAAVSRMIKQANNEGLEKWLHESADSVKTSADIDALLSHMLAVLKQYTLIATSSARSSSSQADA